MSEQFEAATTDGYIQEQQRQRAQKLKRGAFIIGVLLTVAIAISIGVALSSKEEVSASPAQLETSFSLAEQEAARESFKQALANFETEIAPLLSELSRNKWRVDKLLSLENDKARALALFANSGFMQALGILNTAKADALALIAQWHQAYDEKLAQAQDFYRNQQIQQARLALTQADKIKANHQHSQRLRAQLGAFDRVQVFLSQLAIARVENNLENQVALMQQIIEADPTREDMRAPLQESLAQLNQKRLAFALGKAQKALENGNNSEAKTYIQQAEIIQASAKGIVALRNELDKRLATQSLNGIKAELARLQSSDAWQQVLRLAQRGLQRFSRDAELQQVQTKASEILSMQSRIESFIARPERLADNNIRQAAQSAIQQSILLLSSSNALALRANTLAQYVDQYSAKVAVTVLSDGKTDISVIGTGVVGLVESKVIELSPGKYIFEGKREGYRSKRIEVDVSTDTPATVSLVCDQKINE